MDPLSSSREDRTAAALRWLDAQGERMVSDLMGLADQNSGSDNLAGLRKVADQLELLFKALSCDRFERRELCQRTLLDDRAVTQSFEAAPALCWHKRKEAPRQVLLAIHYDTVYGVDHPFQKCYWSSEGASRKSLYGPGVADAKGGIVLLLYALLAAEKFSLLDDLGWSVVLNPDEEIGSPSTLPLWRELASQFDFGLLFEPALPDGSLVSQRKGSGLFTMIVTGRAAHAGRDFSAGRNAIIQLAKLLIEIDQLNGTRPGVTLNVGKVVGGGAVNVVPDLATARINVRIEQESDRDWIIEQFSRLTASYNSDAGYSCRFEGDFTAGPKAQCSRTEQLMRAVEQAAALEGETVRWKSTGGVSDGNKLATFGLVNLDTLGPVGDGLHSSQEWVDPASLVGRCRRLLRILEGTARRSWQMPARNASLQRESLSRSPNTDRLDSHV